MASDKSAQRDLASYSVEEKRRIARRARRNVASECTLIMTAGFSASMVFLFFFGNYTFLPIAVATGLRPIAVWVALAFSTAALVSFVHFLLSKSRVAEAKTLQANFLYQHQDAERAAREVRLRGFEERE